MSEEFDFSELRNYLQSQIDLGDAELFMDEPWTLTRSKVQPTPARPAPAPVRPSAAPSAPAVNSPSSMDGGISGLFDDSGLFGSSSASLFKNPSQGAAAAQTQAQATPPLPAAPAFDMPAARAVKKMVSAYESATSLEAFYDSLAKESIYAGNAVFAYEGPDHPKFLLLLETPRADVCAGKFLESPTGEMLVRLFASLNIEQSNIGVSFFYKSFVARAIPPLVETALRKMLSKELSFIQPQVMVTFGEPLFHKIFGKGMAFNDCAGTDLEFNGVKTCALVDAFAMTADKQLKWLTWKVHIPRSSYFKA